MFCVNLCMSQRNHSISRPQSSPERATKTSRQSSRSRWTVSMYTWSDAELLKAGGHMRALKSEAAEGDGVEGPWGSLIGPYKRRRIRVSALKAALCNVQLCARQPHVLICIARAGCLKHPAPGPCQHISLRNLVPSATERDTGCPPGDRSIQTETGSWKIAVLKKSSQVWVPSQLHKATLSASNSGHETFTDDAGWLPHSFLWYDKMAVAQYNPLSQGHLQITDSMFKKQPRGSLPEPLQVGMRGHTWMVLGGTECASAGGPAARRPRATPRTAAAAVASPLWRLPVDAAPKLHLPARIHRCKSTFPPGKMLLKPRLLRHAQRIQKVSISGSDVSDATGH